MTNGFLIYGEKFAHFLLYTYQEALPHIWLCTRSHLNFLIYDDNFDFVFFFSVFPFHDFFDLSLLFPNDFVFLSVCQRVLQREREGPVPGWFPTLAGPATARGGPPGKGVAGLISAIRERRTKLSTTRAQDQNVSTFFYRNFNPATARGGSPGMGVAGLNSAIRERRTKTFPLFLSKFQPGNSSRRISRYGRCRTKLSNTRVQD